MKEQNDIDQIFESKLNNNTFELKDTYLADFESKLDVYNKKNKPFFWLVFSSLMVFTIVYDFIILPNQMIQPCYKITEVKEIQSNLNCINEPKHSSINIAQPNTNTADNLKENNHSIFSSLIKNEKETTTDFIKVESIVTSKNSKTEISQPEILKTEPESSQIRTQKTKPDLIKTQIEKINHNLDQDSSLLNKEPSNYDESNSPDVYIDDTIRRQVFIVDTIVKIDTIVINDTIKNKIRLFKKKN